MVNNTHTYTQDKYKNNSLLLQSTEINNQILQVDTYSTDLHSTPKNKSPETSLEYCIQALYIDSESYDQRITIYISKKKREKNNLFSSILGHCIHWKVDEQAHLKRLHMDWQKGW